MNNPDSIPEPDETVESSAELPCPSQRQSLLAEVAALPGLAGVSLDVDALGSVLSVGAACDLKRGVCR
ncbi:MAG: hypothetical protein ACK542_02170 [Burkholderiales bacterium]